ncbi:MAG TPA: hypothetical protein VHV83_02740 [Armatimonadota bacterium]|nr:hypothetical protein [Armatimonadota bacterium]
MVDSFHENSENEPSEQIAGRFVGIVVFLAGIVLLVLTFILAYQAFHNPDVLLPVQSIRNVPPVSPTFFYARAFVLLLLLFVMGYVASLIAARGAQLFFSARREVHRVSTGD